MNIHLEDGLVEKITPEKLQLLNDVLCETMRQLGPDRNNIIEHFVIRPFPPVAEAGTAVKNVAILIVITGYLVEGGDVRSYSQEMILDIAYHTLSTKNLAVQLVLERIRRIVVDRQKILASGLERLASITSHFETIRCKCSNPRLTGTPEDSGANGLFCPTCQRAMQNNLAFPPSPNAICRACGSIGNPCGNGYLCPNCGEFWE